MRNNLVSRSATTLLAFMLAALATIPLDLAAGVDAVIAVQSSLDVERALLQDDYQRFDQLSARRGRALNRLAELYQALDVAVKRRDSAGPEAVETLMDQIEGAEQQRVSLLTAERVLVDRISERLRKIGILEAQVAALSDHKAKSQGRLTGEWNVVLLPINQRGVFSITQTGTLVSGTYTLEGGWDGSLQGTLVNRKVYLVRVDSKLGRSMEFEGQIQSDGKRITGTWLNYELAGQEGSTGQWSAVRVSAKP